MFNILNDETNIMTYSDKAEYRYAIRKTMTIPKTQAHALDRHSKILPGVIVT